MKNNEAVSILPAYPLNSAEAIIDGTAVIQAQLQQAIVGNACNSSRKFIIAYFKALLRILPE